MNERVGLGTIAREWGRIGCVGFGGPPAHITLLRRLCVRDREWMDPDEFEDGIAATNLLPGPASTQLAILCAWRLRGLPGAVVGGTCFIVPGLVLILLLAVLFLSGEAPSWIRGAAAGAGAAVAAVAVRAALDLVPSSRERAQGRAHRARWYAYLLAGGAATVAIGPYLVLVLVACGFVEMAVRRVPLAPRQATLPFGLGGLGLGGLGLGGGLVALSWLAFNVGALSYGGGFVIIPLMQSEATGQGWMTMGEFTTAVALGQITPGPVVQTVAVVGYAAAGLGGALLATLIAFVPSFAVVLAAAPHFGRLRSSRAVQGFFDGAGPAVIGAIAGSAIPLARALEHPWQFAVLGAAALALLAFRRGVVSTLLGAGALGVVAALAGLTV
ncbi:chromate efflux transporter [Actinomadura sp. NBRC 104412]|uniref:chromate efflux transporter n=1 Tax=Actinomadura sp. NBRC 104412 TaxID=3032203 RepID=UPI0025561084|nr:chromate efflux transporter [Actinomadura sp. NBRC 104412]